MLVVAEAIGMDEVTLLSTRKGSRAPRTRPGRAGAWGQVEESGKKDWEQRRTREVKCRENKERVFQEGAVVTIVPSTREVT